MNYEDSHLSDHQLLLDVERELPARDQKPVRAHLDACWKCRARRQELENAIADFVRAHQGEFDEKLPPAAGRRALLKAQLDQLAATEPRSNWFLLTRRLDWALRGRENTARKRARQTKPSAPPMKTQRLVSLRGPNVSQLLTVAACGLAVLGLLLVRHLVSRPGASLSQTTVVSIPDSRLTPGATILAGRQAVCALSNVKNKTVPVALQKQVFQEYGIAGSEPQAYEVDYLVTPALGGADDIRNLWPHSYRATVWNARVKDALEDRLRDMVCDGSLDLEQAQKDIAENWIAAYKKYFRTEQPLLP